MYQHYKRSRTPGYSNRAKSKGAKSAGGDTNAKSSFYCDIFSYGPERLKPKAWERDDIRKEKRCVHDAPEVGTKEPAPEPAKPKPKPKPEPPKEVKPKLLTIESLDLHVEKNVRMHRTDKYECTEQRPDPSNELKTLPAELVVRRGFTFLMTMQLDRKFDRKQNDMRIALSFGENPIELRKTQVHIDVDESEGIKEFPPKEWGAQIVSMHETTATVQVSIPADCIVGEWNLSVKTITKGDDGKDLVFAYEHPEDIIILFNPWCQHDDVYMEASGLLDEYILNDSGCVFRGSKGSIGAKEWNFGQFQDPILECCLYLLRSALKYMPAVAMSNPVSVSRGLAAIVNEADDEGVLVGNWSGNYEGGIAPSKWVGSVKILEQYFRTGEPVCYGQCWVFSGVLVTVCRALGIPCRSITNFASAHDTTDSRTIDVFYTRNNKNKLVRNNYSTTDSVWNFHVWNEVWMRRQDVKSGFDGWQALDSTPQEMSEGIFTCGPCPMAAIKDGQCDVKYDAGFIFSEVNADRIFWENTPFGDRKIKTQKHSIGKDISTKLPDGLPFRDSDSLWLPYKELMSKKRLDVTNEYKFTEGSEKNEAAVLRAYSFASNPQPHAYEDRKALQAVDVEIKMPETVMIGQPLNIEVVVKNPGKYDREINELEIRVYSTTYKGMVSEDPFIDKQFYGKKIPSKKEISETMTVSYVQYRFNIDSFAMLNVEAEVTVMPIEGAKPDPSVLESHDDFRFRRPELDVEAPKEGGKVGEPVKFNVSFKNPVPIKLTKWDISTESTVGFKDIEDYTDPKKPEIEPSEMFSTVIEVVPKKKGNNSVTFSFDSKELQDVTGSAAVLIR